jgi:nucleoside-diphosphate-sugar epimerase
MRWLLIPLLAMLSGCSTLMGDWLSESESPTLVPRQKYLAEMLIEHCRQTQGLRCTMLRSSSAYGIGSDRPKFIYNFIDKPDLTMNQLVGSVKQILGQSEKIGLKLPFCIGYAIGKAFDLIAAITGKRFAISSIRIKKFCADSVYGTSIEETGFVPSVPLSQALERTISHEFIENHENEPLYFSE